MPNAPDIATSADIDTEATQETSIPVLENPNGYTIANYPNLYLKPGGPVPHPRLQDIKALSETYPALKIIEEPDENEERRITLSSGDEGTFTGEVMPGDIIRIHRTELGGVYKLYSYGPDGRITGEILWSQNQGIRRVTFYNYHPDGSHTSFRFNKESFPLPEKRQGLLNTSIGRAQPPPISDDPPRRGILGRRMRQR